MSLFPSIFCAISLPFSLVNSMENTSYVFSFRMVFFYLVTTGWVFYISLCEKMYVSVHIINPLGFNHIQHCNLRGCQSGTWYAGQKRSNRGTPRCYTFDSMLLPSGNPFKRHEEVLYLQPMVPPKRVDICPPDWGMLRRPRCVQIFLLNI